MHCISRVETVSICTLYRSVTSILLFQVLLSKEDLKMMMDEVSDKLWSDSAAESCPAGTVNLAIFLRIMENSAW